MKEAEWLSCTDPSAMLAWLLRKRAKPSARKVRLFACACCRRIWPLITDTRSRTAVELAERYADRLARKKEVRAAWDAAAEAFDWIAAGDLDGDVDAAAAAEDTASTADSPDFVSLVRVADRAADAIAAEAWRAFPPGVEAQQQVVLEAAKRMELATQAVLLLDIFGNPFRASPIRRSWLKRNDGAVVKLARAIHEERAFDRMPELGEVLRAAGCDDQEILDHCYPGRPWTLDEGFSDEQVIRSRTQWMAWRHVRGCWVIDLLLGKK